MLYQVVGTALLSERTMQLTHCGELGCAEKETGRSANKASGNYAGIILGILKLLNILELF